MAATAASGYTPVEVYLRSTYEPDAEYVDGVIEERPLGEYDHASWQESILAWFRLHASEWGIKARPELRLQIAPTRYRIPDVTVLDRNAPRAQIITHPPLAVFEVLSPDDTLRRMMSKLGDYAAMGIAEIWVIDPETKHYYRFHDGKLEQAAHFRQPGDRIHFAISEIEAFLD